MKSSVVGVCVAVVVACRPELPLESTDTTSDSVEFELEPKGAELDAVPLVVRVHATGALTKGVDPAELVLVTGDLTTKNLTQLEAGVPSEALSKRMLEATTFAQDGELVLVPHAPLIAGERYSVGIGRLSASLAFRAGFGDAPLRRTWPIGPSPAWLFYCADQGLPAIDAAARLDPSGPRGRFVTGTPGGHAEACVRFEPFDGASAGVVHPPIELLADGAQTLLTPEPIELAPPSSDGLTNRAACEPGQPSWTFGCADIQDDRVVVSGPSPPVLWIVSMDGGPEVVAVTQTGSRFVIGGFAPSSERNVTVESLSIDGVWRSSTFTVHTKSPRARPILNEMYANALGPEPAQEWVEIYNDGLATQLLDGLVVQDSGGITVLPIGAGELAPKRFALVVRGDFDAGGVYDVPPAQGTLIVRVDELGTNGLSNDGELLRLLAADAVTVLSSLPAKPKPKAGSSLARRAPTILDEDVDGFALTTPPTPGKPNTNFDDGS